MLMANIYKGVQKMTSLEEKKGTMNSEYFGFMSRDLKRRNPIRCRSQGKMDALDVSFDLLKSQLFQCPPPPFNAGATYHSLCKEGGGGERGYNLKFLKQN